MKLAFIGATGRVGSRIATEALSRGHVVTAIALDVSSVRPQTNLVAVSADAGNVGELAGAIAGSDAVVSALRYVDSDPTIVIDALKRAGIKRYIAVGGTGSLEVAVGQRLFHQPKFPIEFQAEIIEGNGLPPAPAGANKV